jgi:hypothetical protein
MWLVDTTIFLNILDVPSFNQNRPEVFRDFSQRIDAGDTFLIPFTSIIESGNHIAQIQNGNHRQEFADRFATMVRESISGNTPWKPLEFPSHDDLLQWLTDFPNNAQQGKGLGDHMIIKQWEEQCRQFPAFTVKIWSLDNDLQGYECNY